MAGSFALIACSSVALGETRQLTAVARDAAGTSVGVKSFLSAPSTPFNLVPNPFAGVWNVAPTLGLDCTVDMPFPYPQLAGGLTLRSFATTVPEPHRLLATPRLRLDFFWIPLATLEPVLVVPLDQTAKTFGGSGVISTDTIASVVTGFGTVLTTAVISIEVTAGFTGPDTFAANLALTIVPRLKILGTWRTADCTAINGTFTATRAP